METDDVGTELPDPASARIAAIRFAGEVLQSEPDHLDGRSPLRVQVTNDDGACLFEIEVRAIEPTD